MYFGVKWTVEIEQFPLLADPCISVYMAHKMASKGVAHTPSDAIL